MAARIDDPALEVTKDSVLVLQSAGPQGAPGLPEWGQLPIPKKLLQQGVRDMLRISDARMSGTSYGACVLHVAPESHIGGPLALVKDGDLIELDVPNRTLNLKVDDAELARRRAAWVAPKPHYTRGFGTLVSQARDAGQRRLRLRLSRGRRRSRQDHRSRNPLRTRNMTTRIALAALAAACAAAPLAAMAQDYPNKPITYIVPFTPGGTTDVIGRTIAQGLSSALGSPS